MDERCVVLIRTLWIEKVSVIFGGVEEIYDLLSGQWTHDSEGFVRFLRLVEESWMWKSLGYM